MDWSGQEFKNDPPDFGQEKRHVAHQYMRFFLCHILALYYYHREWVKHKYRFFSGEPDFEFVGYDFRVS